MRVDLVAGEDGWCEVCSVGRHRVRISAVLAVGAHGGLTGECARTARAIDNLIELNPCVLEEFFLPRPPLLAPDRRCHGLAGNI